MTFREALAAMESGKWVRLRWMADHDELWFFAHRGSVPVEWLDGLNWKAEYYSIHLCAVTLANDGGIVPDSIGGADFSDDEKASDQWEMFEVPECGE